MEEEKKIHFRNTLAFEVARGCALLLCLRKQKKSENKLRVASLKVQSAGGSRRQGGAGPAGSPGRAARPGSAPRRPQRGPAPAAPRTRTAGRAKFKINK